jgi:polyisoprenoid-binding protein YceI
MKSTIKLAFVFGAFALSSCGSKTEEVAEAVDVIYTLDATQSSLAWKGVKIGEEGMHTGTVDIKEGTIVYNGEEFKEGNFAIDLNTIKVTDAELPAPLKDTLIAHLSSPKWFDFVKFPAATVKITEITAKEITATINVLGKDIVSKMAISHTKDDKSFTAMGKFDIDMKGAMVPGMMKEGDKTGVSSVVSFDLKLALKK